MIKIEEIELKGLGTHGIQKLRVSCRSQCPTPTPAAGIINGLDGVTSI